MKAIVRMVFLGGHQAKNKPPMFVCVLVSVLLCQAFIIAVYNNTQLVRRHRSIIVMINSSFTRSTCHDTTYNNKTDIIAY